MGEVPRSCGDVLSWVFMVDENKVEELAQELICEHCTTSRSLRDTDEQRNWLLTRKHAILIEDVHRRLHNGRVSRRWRCRVGLLVVRGDDPN